MPSSRIDHENEYVCHGVTWAGGRPRLLLAPVPTGPLCAVEVMGGRIGLRTTGRERFCTGRFGFTDTFRVEPVPCPERAQAGRGGQCAPCGQQDEFRFAHQAHTGGYASPALERYMAQPHWLYIATFAHGVSKVGTAAQPRKRSRLDEQGALLATFVARTQDGRTVRQLEDTVTRGLGVVQQVRGAAKLAALISPGDLRQVEEAHAQTVQRSVALLADLGVETVLEGWQPPREGEGLRWIHPGNGRSLYPHDLREGEHGFTVEACLGSHALVRLTGPDDAVRYVLDLGVLKGHRLALGDYSSPATSVQTALF